MAKLLCLVAAMLMASVCATALCTDCAMLDGAGPLQDILELVVPACLRLAMVVIPGGFATTESRLESSQHACGVSGHV